ncbi:hypothetical protein KY349_02275 [Candidatus Woesearchaeota archaeon]|nr:hypothetical protein [Candidatus Woesearchaeota archaeon]
MTWWKKVLLGIVIVYFLIAIIRILVYGWDGIGDFLLGPFNIIAGAFEGIAKGIGKAPESYEAGRESARASIGR